MAKKKEQENKELLANVEMPVETQHNLFSRLVSKRKQRKEKKLEQIEKQLQTEEQSEKIEVRLEEANKEVKKSGGKKQKITNVVFFIFNIALVVGILLWNILSSEDFTPLRFSDLNFSYVLLCLLFLALIMFADVLTVHRMIYRKTMRSRWGSSYKSTGILRYYDAVTPMNSGGQAFMVAYLTGRDIPGSTSLSIPMSKLVFQNISWLIITFVCLIVSFVNPSQLISDETRIAVATLSVIGFLLALFVIVFILFMSLSKTVGQKMVSWGLKALVKLHILRNYDKHYAKVMAFIEDYQAIMKDFSKSKLEIIYQLILHSSRTILLFCIPFFIYCAFMGFDGSKFGEFFVFTALVDLSASFIPLPGGTGMNEITFQALFSVYLGGNTFWAILLWRFCSYYFYLIQGIGILSYDTLYGNKKYRWIKAKLALQKESQDFKKIQIENFRRERTKRRIKQKNSKNKE